MKVARTVLNGESGSNAADLHNFMKTVGRRIISTQNILGLIIGMQL